MKAMAQRGKSKGNFGWLSVWVKKGLERNAPFIFNHVMHCDLKQELGKVLGGEV